MSLEVKEEKRAQIISHLDEVIEKKTSLLKKMKKVSSIEGRLVFLQAIPEISGFFDSHIFLREYLSKLSVEAKFALYSLVAIDQGQIVFDGLEDVVNKNAAIEKVLEILLAIERFYQPLGGLIGYHLKVLELVKAKLQDVPLETDVKYFPPPVYDIRHDSNELQKYINFGIRALDEIGELYAVGGAGDRLHLVDEKNGQPQPAAKLNFLGRTLFELLLRDLEAREYLYYKLFQKELKTPIVLMTSKEKMNHSEIVAICEKAKWYGRGQESFFFLIQPLTPVITIDGNWAMSAPLEPLVKPGGHGVIWKLAKDAGAFDWLTQKNRKALLVRQINNPLAGIDSGLLALCGYGFKNSMAFGFASCPRRQDAHEGMNVLKEKEGKVAITNLEYTEFSSLKYHGLEKDDFPANTNILFAKIQDLKDAVEKLPIPGMLVNMKLPVQTLEQKKMISLQGARLESTMQNIADALLSKDRASLKTFIVLNERLKTISVAKKAYDGTSIDETPEGAFYDLMRANRELLQVHCKVATPEINSPQEYLKEGPSVLFVYHPALGPLYSVISQKIRGGHISFGSELHLEIAEVDIENLSLQGSLLILANHVVGETHPTTELRQFSEKVGRCTLRNVQVVNEGIERGAQNSYWKGLIERKEALKIILEGNSEFFAENVQFQGSFDIYVPDGIRAIAQSRSDGTVEILSEPLSRKPASSWKYTFDDSDQIKLTKP